MPCNPQNINPDPSCVNQTLLLDCTTGDLSISNGNTINLGCAVSLLETQTQLVSLNLIGNVLQVVYLGEDGIQQSKTVDLSPIVQNATGISVINSNSIGLTFGSNVLRADFIVDPTSTLPVSASAAGVKFGCCPETPISVNSSNTIQLSATGVNGHTLASNLKYQSSQSILFSDSSNGLLANVKYSTDAGNSITSGSDGALFVQSASSQLASLPTNGFATTGTIGTLLIGTDSKAYRIPDNLAETPVTGVSTNSITLTISGPNNHTVQADLNIVETNSIQISSTVSGVQADLKVDGVTPGNVVFSTSSNGVAATVSDDSVFAVQNTAATVQNPITKVYGYLNNSNGGYATTFISQYGVKTPSFTTTQRLAIPSPDLYDTLFIFDSTLRKFMWYDAINITWVQIG